jgi:hypothetical protein
LLNSFDAIAYKAERVIGGETLGTSNFNSQERMDVYKRLFLLNRSFHFIVQRLGELAPLFAAQDLKDMLGLTQEVQLEINHLLLGRLESMEERDWAHFGKVRIALEKRLRGTEPKRGKKN